MGQERQISFEAGGVTLDGILAVPPEAAGIILFAHGSGSGRFSSRNQFVAKALRQAGLGTFLFDLLTAEEAKVDEITMELRFDINLLAGRMAEATDWVKQNAEIKDLPLGYFGASTGAAAALVAASQRLEDVAAVVSRGGRPDLAGDALGRVCAPTLLLVGGADPQVVIVNQVALQKINAVKELSVIAGAGHLFSEAGALEEVSRLSAEWFLDYLGKDNI